MLNMRITLILMISDVVSAHSPLLSLLSCKSHSKVTGGIKGECNASERTNLNRKGIVVCVINRMLYKSAGPSLSGKFFLVFLSSICYCLISIENGGQKCSL